MSRCRRLLAVVAVAAACVPAAQARPPALARLVGQTIMTGFSGTRPSAALLARIRRGEIGGVILFRGNLAGDAGARALVPVTGGDRRRPGARARQPDLSP